MDRCLPAIMQCLQQRSDPDSAGLLESIKDPIFIFGVEFLVKLFMLANSTSEALQKNDTDLAAAGNSINELKTGIIDMVYEETFDQLFEKAKTRCDKLGIKTDNRSNKRARTVPAALQDFVMDRYLTNASDNLIQSSGSMSHDEQFKVQMRVDFFRPVLDCIKTSLGSRFSTDCVQLLQSIPSVFSKSWNEQGIRTLATVARLDDDLCVVESQMVLRNEDYTSLETLLSLAQTLVSHQHNKVYRFVYQLIVFLLILPVTSATCERSHSKVDLIKSAVRSSMGSDRLENLVELSCEKRVLNIINLSAVVDSFASVPRGLPSSVDTLKY